MLQICLFKRMFFKKIIIWKRFVSHTDISITGRRVGLEAEKCQDLIKQTNAFLLNLALW